MHNGLKLFVATVTVIGPSLTTLAAPVQAEAPAPPVVHVPQDAASIQEAIEMVAHGGEVVVEPAVYHESLVIDGKSLWLRSASDTEKPTLHASSPDDAVITVGSPLSRGTGIEVTIEGFSITGGMTGVSAGWGLSDTVTIKDCDIFGNYGGPGINAAHITEIITTTVRQNGGPDVNGAAVYVGPWVAMGGSLTVTGCTMLQNTGSIGGAIYIYSPATFMLNITECLFEGNVASSHGGAIRAGEATVSISGTTFLNNTTSGSGGAISGGAVSMSIGGSVLSGNEANSGGAISIGGWGSSISIGGSEISGNVAATYGGGLKLSGSHATATIGNCVVAGNKAGILGGGLYAEAHEIEHIWLYGTMFCDNDPDHFTAPVSDGGGNTFDDVCEVIGDLNGDGVVDVSDLLILLAAWGPCADCNDCPADLNDDCAVDVSDLLILLANWG